MDTYEARRRMYDLARQALELLDECLRDERNLSKTATDLRNMELEARALLADAGYPAESAWRSMQRVLLALQAPQLDSHLVHEARSELRDAVETLASLTSATSERDSDFRIIG